MNKHQWNDRDETKRSQIHQGDSGGYSGTPQPRGVWYEHIVELKEHPELGLPILEPLKSDPSQYVRDSVGNWLNDASKTRPDFVLELCGSWEKESGTEETGYIIKKALRTIRKSLPEPA